MSDNTPSPFSSSSGTTTCHRTSRPFCAPGTPDLLVVQDSLNVVVTHPDDGELYNYEAARVRGVLAAHQAEPLVTPPRRG